MGSLIAHLEAGDVDGDGDNDIVDADTGTDQNHVSINGRNETFTTVNSIASGDQAYNLRLADLDADGDLDAAVLSGVYDDINGSFVCIMINDGTGQFTKAGSYQVGNRSEGIEAGEFDGDGDVDLLTSSPGDQAFSYLSNNGDATFAPRIVLDSEDSPFALAVAEINGDGLLDAVACNIDLGANLTRLFNVCDESSINPCPADLNGDGMLNFFDVSAFLSAYQAQNPIADFTDDGQFNFFDVSAFLSAYNAGCP
jgi:hypothetical protein